MNYNWPIIGDKIFGILKGNGFKVQLFDKTGKQILDPHEATRYVATIGSNDPELSTYTILVSVHDENADSHVDIKTPNLDNEKDFEFIHRVRNSLDTNLKREGLSVNWYKFDHTIKPKDEAYNNITESKDISKPFGSTKSSYQKVGDARLIIRHTDAVNEEKMGSRWRHIKAIFVENKIGERFKYPHMHIAGARAMARHVSANGAFYDEIGESIQALSADYMALKESGRLLRKINDESMISSLRESMQGINKKVKSLSGPRGYNMLLDTLREQVITEDGDDVKTLHDSLMERCQCGNEDPAAAPLLVAARYLAKSGHQPKSDIGVSFTRQPDLTSKVHDYPDQTHRLAWQVDELAECVDDDGIRDRLKGISSSLRDHGRAAPEDMDLIRMVYKASKGMDHQPVEESAPAELDRIKQLSGI